MRASRSSSPPRRRRLSSEDDGLKSNSTRHKPRRLLIDYSKAKAPIASPEKEAPHAYQTKQQSERSLQLRRVQSMEPADSKQWASSHHNQQLLRRGGRRPARSVSPARNLTYASKFEKTSSARDVIDWNKLHTSLNWQTNTDNNNNWLRDGSEELIGNDVVLNDSGCSISVRKTEPQETAALLLAATNKPPMIERSESAQLRQSFLGQPLGLSTSHLVMGGHLEFKTPEQKEALRQQQHQTKSLHERFQHQLLTQSQHEKQQQQQFQQQQHDQWQQSLGEASFANDDSDDHLKIPYTQGHSQPVQGGSDNDSDDESTASFLKQLEKKSQTAAPIHTSRNSLDRIYQSMFSLAGPPPPVGSEDAMDASSASHASEASLTFRRTQSDKGHKRHPLKKKKIAKGGTVSLENSLKNLPSWNPDNDRKAKPNKTTTPCSNSEAVVMQDVSASSASQSTYWEEMSALTTPSQEQVKEKPPKVRGRQRQPVVPANASSPSKSIRKEKIHQNSASALNSSLLAMGFDGNDSASDEEDDDLLFLPPGVSPRSPATNKKPSVLASIPPASSTRSLALAEAFQLDDDPLGDSSHQSQKSLGLSDLNNSTKQNIDPKSDATTSQHQLSKSNNSQRVLNLSRNKLSRPNTPTSGDDQRQMQFAVRRRNSGDAAALVGNISQSSFPRLGGSSHGSFHDSFPDLEALAVEEEDMKKQERDMIIKSRVQSRSQRKESMEHGPDHATNSAFGNTAMGMNSKAAAAAAVAVNKIGAKSNTGINRRRSLDKQLSCNMLGCEYDQLLEQRKQQKKQEEDKMQKAMTGGGNRRHAALLVPADSEKAKKKDFLSSSTSHLSASHFLSSRRTTPQSMLRNSTGTSPMGSESDPSVVGGSHGGTDRAIAKSPNNTAAPKRSNKRNPLKRSNTFDPRTLLDKDDDFDKIVAQASSSSSNNRFFKRTPVVRAKTFDQKTNTASLFDMKRGDSDDIPTASQRGRGRLNNMSKQASFLTGSRIRRHQGGGTSAFHHSSKLEQSLGNLDFYLSMTAPINNNDSEANGKATKKKKKKKTTGNLHKSTSLLQW